MPADTRGPPRCRAAWLAATRRALLAAPSEAFGALVGYGTPPEHAFSGAVARLRAALREPLSR